MRMKRFFLIAILVATAVMVPQVFAAKQSCTTIQRGTLEYSVGHYLEGDPLAVGYDVFGYNYQAHMFNSYYANAYLGRYGFPPYEGDDATYDQRLQDESFSTNPYLAWYWVYRNDWVMMKWNDAWLSNTDCDSDGLLDRHYGFISYVGSGAWLTNHQSGTYEGDDGVTYKWNYFVKIVAVPSTATKIIGVWYTAGGVEIGPDIWGEFAVIQEIYNDQGTGDHGLLYKSPACPGFGAYKP